MIPLPRSVSGWLYESWEKIRTASGEAQLLVAAVLLLIVAGVDYFAGPEMSFSVFYLLPISFVAWTRGRRFGLWAAVIGAAYWLALELRDPRGFHHYMTHYWNGSVRLIFFSIVVLLISRIRDFNSTLILMVDEKTKLLAQEIQERAAAEHQMLEIKTETQRSIAHDLHDGLGQHLTGVAFKAKNLAADLAAIHCPLVADAERIVLLVNNAISQTKRLAKGLDPADVSVDGLIPALTRLALETTDIFRLDCRTSFGLPHELKIKQPADLFLFRIAQEAVHNAIKHSRARRLDLGLRLEDRELLLTIRDDGAGLNVNPSNQDGLGLRGMRQRARDLGGTLAIESPPSGGTEVRCAISRSQWIQNDFDHDHLTES